MSAWFRWGEAQTDNLYSPETMPMSLSVASVFFAENGEEFGQSWTVYINEKY